MRADLTEPGRPTHAVENQAPPLPELNLFASDRVLKSAVAAEGGAWAEPRLGAFGLLVGSHRVQELGRVANRQLPELRTHDRFGHRIDEVDFHPAWHELMAIGREAEIHGLPWTRPEPGSHVARAALAFLMNQAESGVCCPFAMTFAAIPSLRQEPALAARWEPRLTAAAYDPRALPAKDKVAAGTGMAMTEKQGGSDVRANTTRAVALAENGGAGGGEAYHLTGHKWFCSAPMSDAFLTLAQTEAGLTCFLVPRWLDDGTRNRFFIQRLKDKLGNRSNASAEIEYRDTWAERVGAPGRGVAVILKMVQLTRLDVSICSAALMRRALLEALHHAAHRRAFQKTLIDQPLMENQLADMALESEAATRLVLRLAGAFDRAAADDREAAFARIATPVVKYWLAKRAPGLVFEAMEVLGGNAYVEESVLPRLYREAPVSAIWEGCGNVICLDVLRALAKAPDVAQALMGEL
ncbi:MAG: acyl-CoA dehydrogenase family protein, partial [Kiloniellales bacterium]|nr:acyl-CoA dehydrogenase family protein [Kiloniellales bacterium]